MATIIKIADAVVDALNTPPTPFSLSFNAERLYQPIFELPEMADLHVSVVPSAIPEMKAETRQSKTRSYAIDIAVQQKISSDDPSELDPLMDLVEEIIDAFDGKRLDNYSSAICVLSKNEPVFDPEHLAKLRQFTSVITLTYRVSFFKD